jgi:hypothetical protein
VSSKSDIRIKKAKKNSVSDHSRRLHSSANDTNFYEYLRQNEAIFEKASGAQGEIV